jgi:hypothetical protein
MQLVQLGISLFELIGNLVYPSLGHASSLSPQGAPANADGTTSCCCRYCALGCLTISPFFALRAD